MEPSLGIGQRLGSQIILIKIERIYFNEYATLGTPLVAFQGAGHGGGRAVLPFLEGVRMSNLMPQPTVKPIQPVKPVGEVKPPEPPKPPKPPSSAKPHRPPAPPQPPQVPKAGSMILTSRIFHGRENPNAIPIGYLEGPNPNALPPFDIEEP